MERISREEMMTAITKIVAKRGTCLRAQVGCLIEKDGRILSLGWNGSAPGEKHCIEVGCLMEDGHCIRTRHAEQNCIGWAARNGITTLGATLWVYGWQGGICVSCRKLADAAGIAEIKEIPLNRFVFGELGKSQVLNVDEESGVTDSLNPHVRKPFIEIVVRRNGESASCVVEEAAAKSREFRLAGLINKLGSNLCSDCNHPLDDANFHFEAPEQDWGGAMHHFRPKT